MSIRVAISTEGYGLEKEECDHPHEEDCEH